jgi:hypothetical protein
VACIFDEVSQWRDETSATPDIETYRAVLPSMLTTKGMLIGISSPYRRIGLLHRKHRDYFGVDDPAVLVVQAPSLTFNPTLDVAGIESARKDDPEAALAEYDAEFRTDIAALLDDVVIDAAIDRSRPLELPPAREHLYQAFVDASAGRHDAFTLCIGHHEGDRFVADVVRGAKAPFADPNAVAADYAQLARDYRCTFVTGDHYAGAWVSQAFERAGIGYRQCKLVRSELYLEGLAPFNRGAISIPDHPQLIRELRLLERKVHRSGRDAVDHPTKGSGDYANVLFGAAWLAQPRKRAHPVALAGYTKDGKQRWLCTPARISAAVLLSRWRRMSCLARSRVKLTSEIFPRSRRRRRLMACRGPVMN